jgi:hypothetical protein
MSEKGFFQRLFDLEFKEFIATRIIPTLYVIAIIVSALFSLGIIIDGFSDSFLTGLIKLIIIAPLTFLLTVISARVILEVVMVFFKISENIALLAEKKPVDVSSNESENVDL